MRDVNTHPFKAVGSNTAVNVSASAGSATVTVPFARNPEYPGVCRVVNAAPVMAYVRSSTTPSPVATAADMACPPNVVCYFLLDIDTVAFGVFSAGSGVVNVQFGTGGVGQ